MPFLLFLFGIGSHEAATLLHMSDDLFLGACVEDVAALSE